MLVIILGWQIVLSLMFVSFIGVWLISGDFFVAIDLLAQASYYTLKNYTLGVLPLFILMGLFANQSGASADLFSAANVLFKRVKGGIPIATIIANTFFGAITGVTIAASAMFTKVALPEMARLGYDKKFACGTIAGGSVIGMLIPPSLLMIIYGPLAEVSIGHMFIGGIVPGLLLGAIYIIGIMVMVRLRPSYFPAFNNDNGDKIQDFKSGLVEILKIWPILALILLVLGGIWFGFFTPTEAGGIGAFGAFILVLGKKKLTIKTYIKLY